MSTNLERYRKMIDRTRKVGGGESNIYFSPRKMQDVDDAGHVVRFLPIPGWPEPGISVYTHRFPVGGKFPQTFLDPRSAGLSCPACDILDELPARPKTGEERDLRDLLKRSMRWIFLVVDQELPHEGPKLYEAPNVIANLLVGLSIKSVQTEGIDPVDPWKGFDICIQRRGEGFDTSYNLIPERRVGMIRPDDPEATEDILRQAAAMDLFSLLRYHTEKTIEEAMEGVYDKDAAKRRIQERDEAGRGPRRIGNLPEDMTEEDLVRWVKENGDGPYFVDREGAPLGDGPAAPSKEEEERPPEYSYGDEDPYIGKRVRFETEEGPTEATIKSRDASGWMAYVDGDPQPYALEDESVFELVPETPQKPAPRKPAPRKPSAPAKEEATVKSPSQAAKERLAEARRRAKEGGS